MNKLLCIFLLSVTPAMADDYLVINGVSTHFGQEGYQQHNSGFGYEHRFDGVDYCSAGYLENSMRDQSIYAGCGRRWWAGSRFRAGVGVFAGLVRYPSSQLNTLPAVLPVVSVEYGPVGVNVILIPAVTKDMAMAALAQAYIRF